MKKPIETSDKGAIAVLLECLKKVKLNNKYWNPQIETAPIDYEISFNFSNGERKTYIYTVYPSEKYDNPFEEFFKLFPDAFSGG